MKRSVLARVAPPVLLVAGLLAGWEAWVRWRGTPAYLLPAPSAVVDAGVESAHLLVDPVVVTAVQTVTGLIVGAAIGVALALAVVAFPVVRRAVGPLLIASQTFPTILLAPLLVVTFGLGATPKIVLVALVTFFPVAIATATGLDGADEEYLDLVRALGGSRATVLRVVQGPAALPSFFSGLRIASAWAVAAAVLGQMNGGDEGLGVFINRSRSSFQTERLYAAFVVIAVLSGLLYALVGLLGRVATPWLRAGSVGGPGTDHGGHRHMVADPAAPPASSDSTSSDSTDPSTGVDTEGAPIGGRPPVTTEVTPEPGPPELAPSGAPRPHSEVAR